MFNGFYSLEFAKIMSKKGYDAKTTREGLFLSLESFISNTEGLSSREKQYFLNAVYKYQESSSLFSFDNNPSCQVKNGLHLRSPSNSSRALELYGFGITYITLPQTSSNSAAEVLINRLFISPEFPLDSNKLFEYLRNIVNCHGPLQLEHTDSVLRCSNPPEASETIQSRRHPFIEKRNGYLKFSLSRLILEVKDLSDEGRKAFNAAIKKYHIDCQSPQSIAVRKPERRDLENYSFEDIQTYLGNCVGHYVENYNAIHVKTLNPDGSTVNNSREKVATRTMGMEQSKTLCTDLKRYFNIPDEDETILEIRPSIINPGYARIWIYTKAFKEHMLGHYTTIKEAFEILYTDVGYQIDHVDPNTQVRDPNASQALHSEKSPTAGVKGPIIR